MSFRLRENAYYIVVFSLVFPLSLCDHRFVIDSLSHVRRLKLHNDNSPGSSSQ